MHTEFPAGTTVVKLEWSAYDGESGLAAIEVSMDGSKVPITGIVMAWTFTSLAKGVHTVTVTARDVAGNEGRAMVAFSIGEKISDTTKPNVKITAPNEGDSITPGDITVQWTGDDAGSGIFCYYLNVDGKGFLSMGNVSSHVLKGLSEGRHTVTLKAVDGMGNEAEAKVAFTLTSDVGPGDGGDGTGTTTLLGMPFTLLWLVLAAAAIGGAIVWASRRKPKRKKRRIKEGEG
jgi:large repetitive protein